MGGCLCVFFFFQAEDGIRDGHVTGVQTCALPISPKRLEAARNFAVEAARLAANTRCHNVVVLDLQGLSPVCDFFILASGTSPRQMRTVADQISELGQKLHFAAFNQTGYEGESWILVDFIDVV